MKKLLLLLILIITAVSFTSNVKTTNAIFLCVAGDASTCIDSVNAYNKTRTQSFVEQLGGYSDFAIQACGPVPSETLTNPNNRSDVDAIYNNWINCASDAKIKEVERDSDQATKNKDISNIQIINARIDADNASLRVNQTCGSAPSTPSDSHDEIQRFDTASVSWINCVGPVLNNIEIENKVTEMVLERLNAQKTLNQTPTTSVETAKTVSPTSAVTQTTNVEVTKIVTPTSVVTQKQVTSPSLPKKVDVKIVGVKNTTSTSTVSQREQLKATSTITPGNMTASVIQSKSIMDKISGFISSLFKILGF